MGVEDNLEFDRETLRYGHALLRYARALINKEDASAEDLLKAEALTKEAE